MTLLLPVKITTLITRADITNTENTATIITIITITITDKECLPNEQAKNTSKTI